MVKGLKEWPRQDRRQVAIPFFAFRVVVGIGLAMLAIVAWSLWLRWRGQLAVSPSFLWVCQWVSPLGFIAVLADWMDEQERGFDSAWLHHFLNYINYLERHTLEMCV